MSSSFNFTNPSTQQTHLSHLNPQNPTSPSLQKPSFLSPIISSNSNATKLVVSGGCQLSGHVDISGSKNSALAILAGTLCCSGTTKLCNIPNVSDIRTMVLVLKSLGVEVEVFNGEMIVNSDGIYSVEPCDDAVGRIRAGFFVAGPLLARFGEAVVAMPGGCDIGARPIDIYVRGFRALGANVELRERKLYAHAANGKGLVAGRFHLDFPSVGATETLMMAASMADGMTMLSNVAQEPEVVDLARFLNDCGASVEGAGSNILVINGRKKLHGPEFSVIPDRIEAGTFLIAAAITGSSFSMSPVIPSHLTSVIKKLSNAGCHIIQNEPNALEIAAMQSLQGFNIRTGPFPQFPTDLQPQTMGLLTMCKGQSIVEELVFEGRMTHVRELMKLGACIRVCGSTAVINGKGRGRSLRGARVVANDLRSGAALVLAGLAAQGITEIEGVTHIDRGYENLEAKLCCLGADIVRKSSSLATQL